MEEGQERTAAEANRRNNEMFWKYLRGNNTLVVNDLSISQLSLRSRPEYSGTRLICFA